MTYLSTQTVGKWPVLLPTVLAVLLLGSSPPAHRASIPPVDGHAEVGFTSVPASCYQELTEGGSSAWFATRGGAIGCYAAETREAADRYGVDPRLIHVLIEVESAFDPQAVSRKGAKGLMQLMPQTASILGVRNPFNPRQNIRGGVRHLRGLILRYRGDLPLALAAYHAGHLVVDRYRGIPPYPETQRYVRRIVTLYRGSLLRSHPPHLAVRTYTSDSPISSVVRRARALEPGARPPDLPAPGQAGT